MLWRLRRDHVAHQRRSAPISGQSRDGLRRIERAMVQLVT
jgi:hypothetical protein